MSAEVLIMTILGGMFNFFGPVVGVAVLLYLRMLVGSYTEYWPFILGLILSLLVFFLPGGIMGFLENDLTFLKKKR
jgi:branched-chain amino acid transport system permease protein